MTAEKHNKIEEPEKGLFFRQTNNLKVGIVGLPNVGKSSLFNVLTESNAKALNFPFCTIDPAEAQVAVPDERFDWLCSVFSPKRQIPACLSLVDIAGLVRGASQGEGLGNAFLSHIKAVDGIIHVVRAFESDVVAHVESDVNPIRDIEIINNELKMKDIEVLTKSKEGLDRITRTNPSDKENIFKLATINKTIELLEKNMNLRNYSWKRNEVQVLKNLYLLNTKPIIYLINISEEDFIKKKNRWLKSIKNYIDENSPGDIIIPMSVSFEESSMKSNSQSKSTTSKVYVSSSAIPKLITSSYSILNLIYFFTVGQDEVRAWTIKNGIKAPQAAGVIHTDFEEQFIMAEVMHYSDFFELKTTIAVKNAGKYHQKGKDYIVQDGDILHIKFNTPNIRKKK